MNAITKEPMPEQPKTMEMPRVEVPTNTLDAVLSEVRAMRTENADKLVAVVTRLDSMECRLDRVEQRQDNNSIRAKSDSVHDSEQDAKIEQLVVDIGSVKTDLGAMKESQASTAAAITRIESAVTGFVSNPKVKFVGRLIFVLAAGYAAAKGIKVLP